MNAPAPSQRADIWLFRSRLFKTRGLAGKAVEAGHVRVDRGGQVARLTKPGAPVRAGDRLVVRRGSSLFRLTVLGLGERRGPASEARALYELEQADKE